MAIPLGASKQTSCISATVYTALRGARFEGEQAVVLPGHVGGRYRLNASFSHLYISPVIRERLGIKPLNLFNLCLGQSPEFVLLRSL